MKNNYKITDFPEDSKILFNDGEEWIVVKKGMRGTGSYRKSDEITIKPFNKLAKDKNVSLAIDVNLDYLNANVKKINESEVNESNNIEVGTFVRYKKDKDFTGGKVKSIKGGNAEIHNWDGSTTELPIKDLEYVKSWNESEVNEGRSQIKRKYGEHGAIRVNSEAPVRNSILEFVGKRFVTRAELDAHLTQLSEDRGKAIDQTKWFSRNMKYFESFSNRGSEVWTLSKYGKRVLENLMKARKENQEKTMIKESIGLFKFNSVNESIDVKYWADYNDDTSAQAKKEFAEKSNKFNKDFFNKAMNSWNSEAEGDSTLRAFSPAYSKIYKMAEEFFKKAGWISTNVIHAMIMQES
jgi:hypothetical protein